MDDATLYPIAIPIAILLVIALVYYISKKEAAKKEKIEELRPQLVVPVGKYLAGLPNVNQSDLKVDCAVRENELLFLDEKANPLDRIPRDAVNQIILDDKSQITSRLTVTRMLTLGVFSLAAPKTQKNKAFCLVIDWDDENGERQNTIFEFTGPDSNTQANKAANELKRYVKTKVERLKPSEKKCPYCAEVIKTEAIICSFCNKELGQSERQEFSKK